MKIGFIGQGFVGKAYAEDFEARGHDIVRYSMEEPYVKNKAAIALCDIVFIAVPTPTTTNGFDDHILRDVLSLVGKGRGGSDQINDRAWSHEGIAGFISGHYRASFSGIPHRKKSKGGCDTPSTEYHWYSRRFSPLQSGGAKGHPNAPKGLL